MDVQHDLLAESLSKEPLVLLDEAVDGREQLVLDLGLQALEARDELLREREVTSLLYSLDASLEALRIRLHYLCCIRLHLRPLALWRQLVLARPSRARGSLGPPSSGLPLVADQSLEP